MREIGKDETVELDEREANLNQRAAALEVYTNARHKRLLGELETEEAVLRKRYDKLDAELADREKNLPDDLIKKEKELEGREKTIMEREELLHPRKERLKEREVDLNERQRELDERERRLVVTARKEIRKEEKALAQKDKKWLNGNVSKLLDEREAKLNDAQEKIEIEKTKLDLERKRLGIDKVTSKELRKMRDETDEKAQNAKAVLNHAEDRLKELNAKKAEVDKLQKKLTLRLDAVEALMAGNVKEAVEEFV